MRLIYCAGPYSAHTREAVEMNIRAMERLGVEVAKLGAMPVVPHSNTSAPEYETVQPYPFWIDGTLELMRRCDAVLLASDWKRSRGACGERDEARAIGMPVFETLAQLDAWLRGVGP
jgi:hypothetical protein